MMRYALRAILLACTLTGAAHAQGTEVAMSGLKRDPNAPVEVTADQLQVDQKAGTAVFSGNVLVVQGTMRLAAAEIQVIYARSADGTEADTSKIDHMVATGGVTMTTDTEAAKSAEATYAPDSGEVVMTGDVVLTQGDNTMAGQKLTVDLDTGTGHMDGRVRTVIQPSQKDPAKPAGGSGAGKAGSGKTGSGTTGSGGPAAQPGTGGN